MSALNEMFLSDLFVQLVRDQCAVASLQIYSSASVTTSSGLVASSFRSPISEIGEDPLVGTVVF